MERSGKIWPPVRKKKVPMRRKDNGKMITLTFENIHACVTRGHGWTRAQLQLIGVGWPPRHGWLRGLIGKTIPMETYERFREARHTRVQLSEKTLARYREREERRRQKRKDDRARRVAARAEALMGQRMRPHSWRRSSQLPCSRCGKNERYLDLEICEECVSAISGYRDAN
jgi:hypothetical protein